MKHAQKNLCPKNLCPGNMPKTYAREMLPNYTCPREMAATFDNARDECSRTIPAKNVRKYNARNMCRK